MFFFILPGSVFLSENRRQSVRITVRPWGDCCGIAVIMVRCILVDGGGWKGLLGLWWPLMMVSCNSQNDMENLKQQTYESTEYYRRNQSARNWCKTYLANLGSWVGGLKLNQLQLPTGHPKKSQQYNQWSFFKVAANGWKFVNFFPGQNLWKLTWEPSKSSNWKGKIIWTKPPLIGFQSFNFQGETVYHKLPPNLHRLLLDARWARRGAKARNLREKLSTWCLGNCFKNREMFKERSGGITDPSFWHL